MFHKKLKLALVSCIRNEAEKLPAFLAYHHALGVSRAYIFLDRCTDTSQAILSAYPWVKIILRDKTAEHMGTHQNLCANKALLLAREENYDWLIHIDADEFAWGNNYSWFHKFRNVLTSGSLLRLLARVSPKTDMVILRSREIVPIASESTAFWKLQYVLNRTDIVRDIFDPTSGKITPASVWFGHTQGKSIVRVAANLEANTPHTWNIKQNNNLSNRVQPNTEYLGWVTHYMITSAMDWWLKFSKKSTLPLIWRDGTPVHFPNIAWRVCAIKMNYSEAQNYFDNWVAFKQENINPYLENGSIEKITHVEDVLKQIKFSNSSGERSPLPCTHGRGVRGEGSFS